MAKATSIKEALARFEKESGLVAADCEKVDISAQTPPIEKMDASLGALKACRHLSLSTNNIERIAGLSGMTSLQILSLGRNQIKKLEGFDGISESMRELWISYNLLEKLAGIDRLPNLRVLLMSNNRIKDWSEVDRLSGNIKLEELLLMGNPLAPATGTPEYRIEPATPVVMATKRSLCETSLFYGGKVVKRLPSLKKVDGVPVSLEEREAAEASRA